MRIRMKNILGKEYCQRPLRHIMVVPPEVERRVFQYSIISIIHDLKTACIDFDDICIKEGGKSFQAYLNASEEETVIINFTPKDFKDDHDLLKEHMRRANHIINDCNEANLKRQEAHKIDAAKNISDLEKKICD